MTLFTACSLSQALECELTDICPSSIQCPNGRWTPATNLKFSQMVSNRRFMAQVSCFLNRLHYLPNVFDKQCVYPTCHASCLLPMFLKSCFCCQTPDWLFCQTFLASCFCQTFLTSCFYQTFPRSCFYPAFLPSCFYPTFMSNCFYSEFLKSCFYQTFLVTLTKILLQQ